MRIEIMSAMRYMLVAAALGVCASAGAETWTLDRCIEYAHTNNISLKIRDMDRVNAEYGVTEARDRFLPTLQAYGRQAFDFGRGLTSENTYANRNTSNFAWSVGMDMPLFQGLAGVRRLDYAKANLRAVVEQVAAARDDITLNVISQYLQVLYSREMVRIAYNQVDVSRAELARRNVLFENGKIAELDIVEATSQLASDSLTAVSADNDYALALLNLAQMLQLPSADGIEVAELDQTEGLLPSVDDVFANALGFNHSMNAARFGVEAAARNISLSRTGYIPTLSMNASLGSSYYHVGGLPNSSFSSQMRDNFARGIGFTLSIPIFDAFGTRNSERRARAAMVTAELQLDDARMTLFHNIQQAHRLAVSAREKTRVSSLARDAAYNTFNAMRDKYDLGRATPTEFDQAKANWFRAEASLLQAKYESVLRTRILEFYNTATPLR